MMYWNRIWVIPAVVMSHVNMYSAIVNVSFFLWFFFFMCFAFTLLVRLSSSAEEWFNQCECASVPALLWVFSRQCCKTLMLYFQSCHIHLIFFFFQHSLSNTHSASHTYTQALDCVKCLMLEIFLNHAAFAMLIVVCLFQAGNTERATKQTALWTCPSARSRRKVHISLSFTFELYILFKPSISIPILHLDPFTTRSSNPSPPHVEYEIFQK